jgi:hypothetical protein
MRNKPDSVYYAERLAAELKAFEPRPTSWHEARTRSSPTIMRSS